MPIQTTTKNIKDNTNIGQKNYLAVRPRDRAIYGKYASLVFCPPFPFVYYLNNTWEREGGNEREEGEKKKGGGGSERNCYNTNNVVDMWRKNDAPLPLLVSPPLPSCLVNSYLTQHPKRRPSLHSLCDLGAYVSTIPGNFKQKWGPKQERDKLKSEREIGGEDKRRETLEKKQTFSNRGYLHSRWSGLIRKLSKSKRWHSGRICTSCKRKKLSKKVGVRELISSPSSPLPLPLPVLFSLPPRSSLCPRKAAKADVFF